MSKDASVTPRRSQASSWPAPTVRVAVRDEQVGGCLAQLPVNRVGWIVVAEVVVADRDDPVVVDPDHWNERLPVAASDLARQPGSPPSVRSRSELRTYISRESHWDLFLDQSED